MNGAMIQTQLNEIVSEFNSSWINLKTSFDYLFEAAKDFSKETRACHGTQVITTVASQAEYNLNSDFLEVMTTDDHNHGIISYTVGTTQRWLNWESYSDLLQDNATAGSPSQYAIADAALLTRITGATNAVGTQVGGESTLASATSLLTAAVGDYVINVTKSYYGIVLAAGASPTTAMFDLSTRGGAYAGWAMSDAFLITPAPRYKLILDPPPSNTGEIVTVSYYAKPAPVYSDYGVYPFATGYEEALIKYAAWLYKYRDSKPQLADPLYQAYDRAMRKGKSVNRKAVGVTGFRINYTSR